MYSADTNIFVYAADPDSPYHAPAKSFLESCGEDFVLCQLVLVELYMQLRNPKVFKKPYSSKQAVQYCRALRACPYWRCVDYDPQVAEVLWAWAEQTRAGIRSIIDARIAFTLQHHGVSGFATANLKHFQGLGFERVWNPIKA